MVQLNPVPDFGAKKTYQYHLTEIFHRNFRTNGKRSRMSNHLYMSQYRQHIILTYFEPLCFGPAGVAKNPRPPVWQTGSYPTELTGRACYERKLNVK